MRIAARRILLVVALLALLGACARMPDTGITPLKPRSFGDLQTYLLNHKADVGQFRLRGPYAVTTQNDYEIRLSTTELVVTDLYLSAHAEKAPLVIFLHGYDSSKTAHSFQAMHVASWGMHALSVQLPNHGPWAANGKMLAKIASFVARWPEILDRRIDVTRIILVGHSFGGTAVAFALADGAPAVGGILLDPATSGRNLPAALRKITAPVLVLGADEHISRAVNRDYFYKFVRGGISELSIKDAMHEDAQYPAETAQTSEDQQIEFAAAIASAAFSLGATGKFDYAWASFGDAIESGKYFNAKKK